MGLCVYVMESTASAASVCKDCLEQAGRIDCLVLVWLCASGKESSRRKAACSWLSGFRMMGKRVKGDNLQEVNVGISRSQL